MDDDNHDDEQDGFDDDGMKMTLATLWRRGVGSTRFARRFYIMKCTRAPGLETRQRLFQHWRCAPATVYRHFLLSARCNVILFGFKNADFDSRRIFLKAMRTLAPCVVHVQRLDTSQFSHKRDVVTTTVDALLLPSQRCLLPSCGETRLYHDLSYLLTWWNSAVQVDLDVGHV